MMVDFKETESFFQYLVCVGGFVASFVAVATD